MLYVILNLYPVTIYIGPACLSPGNDGKDSLDSATIEKNSTFTWRVERLQFYPMDVFPMEGDELKLRVLWLDAKIWVLKNYPKYMLRRLQSVLHEIDETTEINLPNIRESPIISMEETNRKIDTIKRADKRQEVERHFAENDFKQVAELLWVTLKANPTAEESQVTLE